MDPVALVQKEGINLGGPDRNLPAWIDFIRLNMQVDPGFVLTAVYGSGTSLVADKLGFAAFYVIRRSPRVTTLTYYSVKADLGK